MQHIAILGSTGSIGQHTLEVVRRFPEKFRVLGLSANSNIALLSRQVKEFRPCFVAIADSRAAEDFVSKFGAKGIRLFAGQHAAGEMVKDSRLDKVVVATSGSAALAPLLSAIESGKDIALANKEALVMAGPIIMRRARRKKVKILPIDSEQSAIWQCLDKQPSFKLKKIYLTASGGPFRQMPKEGLKKVSLRQVLDHPRWKMGKKISVDSATMMNKGLELLEAMFLFNVPAEKIKILIHPQAIVHSMVEFVDGSVLAQLSRTDMRIPIQYALSYPERLSNPLPGIDFYKLKELDFQSPDFKKFPCLGLALRVAAQLGTAPCVLNAANEACVEEFLKGKLRFTAIPEIIEKVLGRHHNRKEPVLEDILSADTWAKAQARRIIARSN
ncbi:MAG: 1-deoxy-D-xylulose-5-phosphate reductoisomerase [Candidatus Omnitrophica bacterium]|nr:1-deoxy-D-xylulose-5-phosphate reductoisomerase [Candidatus Omnitrophota bacterium]